MPLPDYPLQSMARTATHFLADTHLNDPFDLDPAYQRTSVWDDTQRRELVRSLQMGLPVGAVWTNERNRCGADTRYVIIDGKQRITTVRAWFANEFAVPSDWFELRARQVARQFPPHLPDTYGETITFDELTVVGQRLCRAWQITELQVSDLTEQQEAELFLLVNTAGTSHTPDDLARATTIATAGAAS